MKMKYVRDSYGYFYEKDTLEVEENPFRPSAKRFLDNGFWMCLVSKTRNFKDKMKLTFDIVSK